MAVQSNGFLLVDAGPVAGNTTVRTPLCRGDRPVRRHYCALWKTDNSGCIVEEFAQMLKESFREERTGSMS